MKTYNDSSPAHWLIYCRPGFEAEVLQETQAMPIECIANSGFVIVQGKPRLKFDDLTFSRQLIRLAAIIEPLPDKDRLTPLLESLPSSPAQFGTLWLETPDTNDGKTLSGFIKRFQPLLEEKLNASSRFIDSPDMPRLHVFFPDKHRAIIGISDPRNSTASHMGILRMKMPYEAPSRSTLKLAEAFETFLTAEDKHRWLKAGMHAVDLGAAPGGWTWQLLHLGMKVVAVDNGPLKGVVAEHPHVRHLREDGFRYRPRQPVDWLVCDMVEKPARVAALMSEWLVNGATRRAIFNLKLPMKKRVEALRESLQAVRQALDSRGLKYRIRARQLYHDREEVTVFIALNKR